MFKVLIGFQRDVVSRVWVEKEYELKSLDQVMVEAVGLSVKVTVSDENGAEVAMYCGPEVQVHAHRE